MNMIITNNINNEEERLKIRELLLKFKETDIDSKEEESTYLEFYPILNSLIDPILSTGERKVYLVHVDDMTADELKLENTYEVYIEDIVSRIEKQTYKNFPEEDYVKILNILDYMIDNNVRSYIPTTGWEDDA